MNDRRPRLAHAAVTLAAVLVLTGGAIPSLAATSSPTETSTASVPVTALPSNLSCTVAVTSVNANQQIVTRRYKSDAGRASVDTEIYSSQSLGFTPRAVAKKESASDENALGDSGRDYYATSVKGDLYVIGQNIDGTIEKKLVNSTWAPVRLLAAVPAVSGTPGAYVYAIHDNGSLYRYTVPAGAENMQNTTFVSSGWAGVKNLTFLHLTVLPNGQPAHVLLATLATGQLVEYTIPNGNPTNTGTRIDIRPSTWEILSSLTVGSCWDLTQQRSSQVSPWIGTLASGEARLYIDKNIDTPVGSDIVGYNQIGTDWTNVYSGWGR
ncbi:hypothetical protein [Microbacterium sp. LWH13-1.2]|uniref:hypothetical protein n=1 Tax=Microbacterium sp. LWH13-1.2 TaxID=3135260 RepID=UPI003138700B